MVNLNKLCSKHAIPVLTLDTAHPRESILVYYVYIRRNLTSEDSNASAFVISLVLLSPPLLAQFV